MIGMYLQIAGLVLGLVALVTTVGLGAASYLDVELPARWAFAPILGLAILVCALTTAIWWIPGDVVAWVVLVPIVLLSMGWIWLRRARLRPSRGDARLLLSVVALLVVLTAVLGYPLAAQRSLGPGGFQIYDAPSYAGLEVGLQTNPVTDDVWGPAWDLTALGGYIYGHMGIQQIGFSGAEATIASLIGVEPVRTQAPFMIGLILIGAVGAFGTALVLLGPKRRLASLLAMALYAGPVMFQLFLDGSESALIGIAFMLPMAAVGWLAIRTADYAAIVLLGLLAAGMQVGYPVLFPGVVVAGGVLWIGSIVVRLLQLRRRQASASLDDAPAEAGPGDADSGTDATTVRGILVGHALGAAVVVALTALLALPHFIRNVSYWKLLIRGEEIGAGLPSFDLPTPVLPGWLLGTREFYYLPRVSDTDIQQWLLADVIPLSLLAIIVFAALTRRSVIPVTILALVTLLVGVKVAGDGCGYCMQRSLLPLGALLGLLLTAGIVQIARLNGRLARPAALTIGLAVVVVVGHTNLVLAKRGARGAFFTADSVHQMLDQLKDTPGPVLIEGFAASWDSPGELPTALHSARAGTSVRLDLVREHDDFLGLAYLGGPMASGETLSGEYRTVATRFASVETDRKTLFRDGDLAIQSRAQPFDATVTSGALVNRVQSLEDRVWVHAPLQLRVFGPTDRPAAVEVRIADLQRAQLGELRRGSTVRRSGTGVVVCVPTTKGNNARTAVVPVPQGLVVNAPGQWWANKPVAVAGPSLAALHVVDRCDVDRR